MKILAFRITRTRLIYCLLPLLPMGSIHAQENSAVSETNGKFAARTGDKGTSGVDGSLTFPISESWGGQLDFGSLKHEANEISFLGGHLFWRNPETGLMGVTANKHSSDLGETTEFGIQLEKFYPQFTIRGVFGTQRYERDTLKILNNGTVTPSQSDFSIYRNKDNSNYFSLRGVWYYDNDIAFFTKSERRLGKNHVGAGMEWQIGSNDSIGYSVFADYSDVKEYGSISTVGVRLYFGESKNLKMRHRTADPESGVTYDTAHCPAGTHSEDVGYSSICVGNAVGPVNILPWVRPGGLDSGDNIFR